uniref:Cytochrome b5 heme-binding domain-containing protein n=1 Tax=Leersia perrieri TaxID=77586 RepID=A0A0D9VIT3_9ORYZ
MRAACRPSPTPTSRLPPPSSNDRHIEQAKSVRLVDTRHDTTKQARGAGRFLECRPAVPCPCSAAPSKKAAQFARPVSHLNPPALLYHSLTHSPVATTVTQAAGSGKPTASSSSLCSSLPGWGSTVVALPSKAMADAPEWRGAAESAIAAYTGLSPSAFFTAVAVVAALYVTVSGLLKRPPPPPRRREVEERASQPLPPPVQLGEVTEEDLKVYDGSDPEKPLLMAIKGQIYDVTQSRMFYGPGGPYAQFAGRDASRALAKMSFEQEDLTGDISGLGPLELEALHEWEGKFMSKYVKVGAIKKIIPVSEGDAAATLPTHGGASERGIDVGTIESNRVPEPEENGAASHADAMEKSTVKSDADVVMSNHEDVVEKPDGLPESGVTDTSSHEDAGEKHNEIADTDAQKKISTEDGSEGNGTPEEDERNTNSTEVTVEKPKEAPYQDAKDTSGHEVAEEPKEAPDVDGNNASGNQQESSQEVKTA